jgi:hypothetical protein
MSYLSVELGKTAISSQAGEQVACVPLITVEAAIGALAVYWKVNVLPSDVMPVNEYVALAAETGATAAARKAVAQTSLEMDIEVNLLT